MGDSSASVYKSPNTGYTSVRGLFCLCLPLVFLASSGSIAFFFNGMLLAHYSVVDLQAQSIGNALVTLFQSACVRMGAEAQIFVSQSYSSGNQRQVGVYLWQMIWLSFLSLLVTLPCGYFFSIYYFDSSPVQQLAKDYFYIFMWGNFLFPLSAALNAFFSGRGEVNILYIGTGFMIVTHVCVAFIMIPLIGAKGAAYSQLLAQGLYSLFLFSLILKKEFREKYGTNQWRIVMTPLFSTFRIGVFNGLSAALISLSWIVIVKFVAKKGSDFLTIMAFGNSCAVLFAFLNLGIGQAVSIKASHLLGKKQYDDIGKLIRSSFVLVFFILLILFPPLVIYPEILLKFFFSESSEKFSSELIAMLRFSCRTLWFFELVGGIDRVMRGVLTAIGDTVFMFVVYLFSMSFGTILPFYLSIEVFNILPGAFWVIMTIAILFRNYPLFIRYKRGLWKERSVVLGFNS